MTRLLVCIVLVLSAVTANASMVWSGVAVDPSVVARLKSDEKFLEETLLNAPETKSVYLDKAWHGIHFLLTGSPKATRALASKVIFGGESFGPELGYGRAQLLTPSEVKAIADLLAKETSERVVARYDPKAMERADIYPSIIWVREGKGALDYVLNFYRKLVDFYQQAAARGDAVVFAIL